MPEETAEANLGEFARVATQTILCNAERIDELSARMDLLAADHQSLLTRLGTLAARVNNLENERDTNA